MLESLDNAKASTSSTLPTDAKPQFGSERINPMPGDSLSSAPVEAPLSYGQRALWLMQQRFPESGAYNVVHAVQMFGRLDLPAFRRAFLKLAARHEALRTTFVERDGAPVRLIHSQMEEYVDFEDAQGWSEETLHERLNAKVSRPFNLANGPLVRVLLLKCTSEKWVLLLVMHHIVTDLWSLAIFTDDLSKLYQQEATGTFAQLHPLRADYTDFVHQQEALLSGPEGEMLWAYWRDQLAGEYSVLELPIDHPRPPEQIHQGAVRTFVLDAELTQALRVLSETHDVPLHVTLLAAFQTLLHRYTGQMDIFVGSPKANRSSHFARLIGYFVNTVVLKACFAADPSFTDLLAQIHRTVAEASAHDKYPFSLLVEHFQLPSDSSRTPIFQVMFAWQKTTRIGADLGISSFAVNRSGQVFRFGDLPMEVLPLVQKPMSIELALSMSDLGLELGGMLEYSADLFEALTISRLLRHFKILLHSIVADPQRPISALPLITPEERQTLLYEWNNCQENASEKPTETVAAWQISALIESQARQTPDAVAVSCGPSNLTYSELDRQANQLAHYLHTLGIGRGSRVGLYMERSMETVVGLLAIFKAGATYLPLDLAYPQKRIAFILQEAQVETILTQRRLAERLVEHNPQLVCIDDTPAIAKQPDEPFHCSTLSSDAAYIIYTSGSSGRPRGVLVSYGAITNHCHDMVLYYQLTSKDRVLQFTSLSLDTSLAQIFPTLMVGANLVLRDEAIWTPVEFYRKVREYALTVINISPGYWHQLAMGWAEELGAEGLAQLRLVIVGGDVMWPETLRLWRQTPLANARLLNAYGSTEATIMAAAFDVLPEYEPLRRIPIGRPLRNRRAYILDSYQRPVPVGVPGELYLGGAGLAIGYLDRPELTTKRFVLNPFEEGERLYRTGDLARYLDDGTIEFLGRVDLQIKIRGFRVELDGIASHLRQHPDVREAVVTAREDAPGNPQLVGYVVLRQNVSLDARGLIGFLKTRVPSYMIPAAFVALDVLPMTSSGKVDRQALPIPADQRATLDVTYVAPFTSIEKDLAAIWSQVLRLPRIGMNDDFFELGGDSLKASQVASRLWQAFKVELPLRDFFDHPTLMDLATQIATRQSQSVHAHPTYDAGGASSIPLLVHQDFDEFIPLSFAQERIWFLQQLAPESSAYNISQAVLLDGTLNHEVLKYALAEILLRHASLRSFFPNGSGEPVQGIRKTADVPVHFVDLRSMPVSERLKRAQQLANEAAQQPFDLQHDTLIRFYLFQLEDEKHILLLSFHHIVADVQSLGVLITEVSQLYNGYIEGTLAHLPELPIQYTDFSVWQREWLKGDILASHLRYWREKLDGVLALSLPTDYSRPVLQSYRGKSAEYAIPEDLLAEIRQFSHREGVSLAMTLLAVFNVLLHRYTGQDDIAIGMPIANRTHQDVENVVGTFVNTLIIRTDLSGDPTFRDLLARVRSTALDAYAHQDLPYAKLVAELQPVRDTSRTPLAQVMFNVINVPIPKVDMIGLVPTPYVVERGGAQFDLTLTVVDTESHRAISLEYSTDIFTAATIDRLFGHYVNLLQGIVDNPDQHISVMPLLTAAEYHQTIEVWNDTEVEFPRNVCAHQLIEAQAQRSPNAIALSFEGTTMTYQTLDERANCLAHYLQKRGVGLNTLVGLHIARSPEMVVALLGILKAGGCYVPLDPTYPPDRLAFMLEDTGLKLCLTTTRDLQNLPLDTCDVVFIDDDWSTIAQESSAICLSDVTPGNLVYTIYTSGSTGKPKGVMIPHRAVVNFLWSMKTKPGLTEEDILLSVTSLSFDIAVLELFLPLTVGAHVVLVSDAVAADGRRLSQVLNDDNATVMQATPTTWQMLLASGWQGRDGLKVLCGGEPLTPSLADALSRKCTSLWNMYGPTETTVWSSLARIDDPRMITIGRPINNTQIYILDSARRPVPIGIYGDLYIGGLGLACGYLNRPDLTAARFVQSPFDPAAKSLLYQTGDRARFMSNGEIEILGRSDHQIKLRGHRIELGEIETVLLDHPFVSQAAVVVSEEKDEVNKQLIAYLVLRQDAELSIKALRDFLGQKLPGYMIPAAFVYLDTMVVTPNGKVDRKALAYLHTTQMHDQTGDIPPRDFVELRLTEIWEQVLDLHPIGVRDNFFDLGGHSLLAVRLFSQLETQLGIKLPVVTLFQSPTVEQLAVVVKQVEEVSGWDSLVPITTGGSQLPFFCVHGVGGGVLGYAELARLLGPDQPFYALQARGVNGDIPPHERIEDMAQHYIGGIKAVQPEGPYALGGYSFGGVVAFEMACQLLESGEQVDLLAMLETYAPITFRWLWTPKALLRFLGNLPRWIRDVTQRYYGMSQVEGSLLRSFRQLLMHQSVEALELSERPALVQAHLTAFKAYRPRIYPGHVILFRVPGMALRRAYDPLFGWGEIAAGGVSVKMIPGAHYNILKRPQVEILAEQLRESLAEARHQLQVSDSHP